MKSLLLALLLPLAATASDIPPTPLFSIRLPKRDSLKFIVAGDAGTGDPHLHNGIAALIKEKPIDGILLVGDNVYPCGVESISDPQWAKVDVNFADLGVPIYPVLGNHDYGDPTRHGDTFTICDHPDPEAQVRATGTVPHWTFPARTYRLASPLVDIFMIDTQPFASDWTQPFLGSETAASEAELVRSALLRSESHWRIVAGHHTIYSSGIRGRSVRTEEKNMRSLLLPLLTENRVSLYICGHDHDAELMGSLKREAGEPVFLISGNGAASTEMEARTDTNEPPTIFPKAFPPPPLIGFTLLEIDRHSITVTFYDGTGTRKSDRYVIADK